MEVAGIVLAVVPLAAQLFQSTLPLYSYYSEAQDLGKTSAKYHMLLRIEQYRYKNWGEYAGIDKGTLTPQFQSSTDLNLTLDILAHIAQTLLESRKLEKRYRLDNTCPPASTLASGLQTTQDFASAIATRLEYYARLAQEVKSYMNLASTIKFAIWDKSRFEALINDLGRLNDGLERITGSHQRQLQGRLMLQLLETQSVPNLTVLGSATEIMHPTLSEIATRKAKYLELQDRQLQQRDIRKLNPMDNDPELKLNHSEVVLREEKGASGREFGTYRGTAVMVEWKILLTEMPENQSLCRIRDLAKFLSKSNPSKDEDLSHLLRCLGYFRRPGETNRVALVYETSHTTHHTLAELLKDPEHEYLNLGARSRLALSLAECVFFLHVTGWLHKSIHSGNMIISGNTTNTRTLRSYLVGFNSARLDGKTEISEKVELDTRTDLYQHPDYQASRKDEVSYTRQYDIYSLGLVLLELGMWQSIEVSGDFKPRRYDPTKFLGKLLNRGPVDSLGFMMGNAYKRAVVWCLRGQFERKDGQQEYSLLTDAQKSMVFWDNVILELGKCSVEE